MPWRLCAGITEPDPNYSKKHSAVRCSHNAVSPPGAQDYCSPGLIIAIGEARNIQVLCYLKLFSHSFEADTREKAVKLDPF